jgi:hypothetical protein
MQPSLPAIKTPANSPVGSKKAPGAPMKKSQISLPAIDCGSVRKSLASDFSRVSARKRRLDEIYDSD